MLPVAGRRAQSPKTAVWCRTRGAGTIAWARVLGHRQVTDNSLLALAVRHQGRFVTFDSRVQLDAVAGAQPQHLVVLAG